MSKDKRGVQLSKPEIVMWGVVGAVLLLLVYLEVFYPYW